MRYKPCKSCPFFDPNQLHLDPRRKQGIVDSIRADASFHCHNTVDYDTEDGEGRVTSKSEECVGSVMLQEKEGRLNQMLRIMERIGMYDRNKLDIESVPYESFDAWVEGEYQGASK